MIGWQYLKAAKCCLPNPQVIDDPKWQRRFVTGSRDRKLMEDRLHGGTLESVAAKYKITRERVRQIERLFFWPMMKIAEETLEGFYYELKQEPRKRKAGK
jgi:hypothetical protein